jgi:Restriction endonuclease
MTPKAVLDRLEVTIGCAGSPRELRTAIETELHSFFGLPKIRAFEQAEGLEERVRSLILRSKESCDMIGTFSVLTISSRNNRTVLGSCCIEPDDSDPIKAAKRARLYKPELLNAIRTLTFAEFEKFGSKVLRELGASTVRVTPRSNDQGIDFYGILSIGEVANVPPPICRLAHDVTLRFAGQAKHYPNNPIGPDVIRELIGAIELARYKTFTSDPDLFEDFALLPFHPLLALLFTTGQFTSGAIELGEKAGIILRSGEQLAVFLADRGVGVIQQGNETNYDDPTFRAWLNA